MKNAAAFSVRHDTLQEAVGVLLVMKDGTAPRPSLATLSKHAAQLLHPSKWPVCIVFANDIFKGPTGKVMRIGLANKLSLPEFTDSQLLGEFDRLYESSDVSTTNPNIKCSPVSQDLSSVELALIDFLGSDFEIVAVMKKSRNVSVAVAYVASKNLNPFDHKDAVKFVRQKVHEYLCPVAIVRVKAIPRLQDGSVNVAALPNPPKPERETQYIAPRNEHERKIQSLWQKVLKTEDPIR